MQIDAHILEVGGSINDFDRTSDMKPNRIYMGLAITQTQFDAVYKYLQKIQAGVDTSSVETAINAL